MYGAKNLDKIGIVPKVVDTYVGIAYTIYMHFPNQLQIANCSVKNNLEEAYRIDTTNSGVPGEKINNTSVPAVSMFILFLFIRHFVYKRSIENL